MRARYDDLRTGSAFELTEPDGELRASRLSEVGEVVTAAEDAARAGRWVAGFLTYEAGAAFDRSFPIRRPAPGLPLAWFGIFRSRREVEGLDEVDVPVPRITGLRREGGSDWYRAGVAAIRDEIAAGNAYQVNLTDRFVGEIEGEPFALYAALSRAQRGRHNVFLDLGEIVVCSASPELFLRWDGDLVECRPMKGTAVRHADAGADHAAAAALLSSAKDRAENVMIVDLLRNDLSRIARIGSVEVPELFSVEGYETVWQLTSTVTAAPRPGVELADLLTATFPCGSVTGAPKTAAMRIIDRLEPGPRGLYCGSIGLLCPPGAGPRAEFNVAIRTAVLDRRSGRFVYGAGGGITWSSDPEAEDAEAEAKARILREPRPAFSLLETLRAEHGTAVEADRHLARLGRAAERFGVAFDLEACRSRLAAAVREVGEPKRLRVLLRRNGELVTELHDLGPATRGPVVLGVPRGRVGSDDVFSRYKTTNRAHYERLRAELPAADDVLCINERDEVVETTIANLLYRLGGRWWTPPRASGGLDGVGLAVLLDGGQVAERTLHLAELPACEELAVVSSLRGVRAAVLLGDGVDDRQRLPDAGDAVDADDVGAAERGGATGPQGRGVAPVQ